MTQLPAASAVLDTNRKRFAEMTSGPDCTGCHTPFINPPGFAMEAFDTVGSWQTTEAGLNGTPVAVDTTADIMIDDNEANLVHVTGPAELMAAISTAPGAKARYASKWVSFAYHREGSADDACTVQQLASRMTGTTYTVQNLITDLTQTLSFRVRVAGQ
jgi:hypothetical protein